MKCWKNIKIYIKLCILKVNFTTVFDRLQDSVFGALVLIIHSVFAQLNLHFTDLPGFSNSMYLTDKRYLYYLGNIYAYEAGKHKSSRAMTAYNNGIQINFFKPMYSKWVTIGENWSSCADFSSNQNGVGSAEVTQVRLFRLVN